MLARRQSLGVQLTFSLLQISRHDDERLRLMEEEQEHLNSSLMALTSHFAQVRSSKIYGALCSKSSFLLLGFSWVFPLFYQFYRVPLALIDFGRHS